MKKFLFIVIFVLVTQLGNTQTLYNNGATFTLSTGSAVWVNGNTQIQNGSTTTNNGTFTITGHLTNNATMAAYNTGTIVFSGTQTQELNGSSSYLANHLTINNGAGITLDNSIRINGTASFNNGIANVPDIAKPAVFTSSATVASVSNASHINGYVVKEGIGNFAYPVGDGIRYQPVDVNATANGAGIRVVYNRADAGTAPFTGATPLLYYNTLEHWNITPLSTATGTVTIYWNDYQNVGIGNTADLRVAQLTGGAWLNQNANNTTGSVATGSVTSSMLSTWGPFTLGSMSITSTLPVNWLSVNGTVPANKQPVINWRVNEYNVSSYQVEKSNNGNSFTKIATLAGKGYGENQYTYTDPLVLQQTAYYRIKQSDFDGQFSYSAVLKLSGTPNAGLLVYPIPFKESFTVVSPATQIAQITSVTGKVLQTFQLKQGSNFINTMSLTNGLYILRTADNNIKKIIKY